MKKNRKLIMIDPQTDLDPLIIGFEESLDMVTNGDQFICDIPLQTALQIYKNYAYKWNEDHIKLDVDVEEYLKNLSDIQEKD